MFKKLQQMEENYSILQEKLNQPETYDDPKVAARLNRELKELEEVVSTYRMWEACRQNLLTSGIPEENILTPNLCTCCNPDFLYSHRASHGKRGNLAAFLGLR